MGFCHLHVHDQYSQLDGYGKAEQYAEEAKRLGFTHLGLTNHGNVDGLIKFQKACKEQDIIPVLGSELYIVPDLSVKEKSEKRYHITVLIRSDTGLKNIFKMLTVANLDGFCQKRGGNGQARVDPDLLLRHSEGLIFMSACTSSVVKMPGGVDLLEKLNSKHPGHVFLEVMPLDFQEQKDLNKLKMGLSMEYGWPLVATNDCHYPLERHAKTQEVLLAMQRSAKWNDPKRWKFSVTDLYLKSFQQMRQSFERQGTLPVKTYARALTNTMMVAEMCNSYYIKSVPVVLPKVPGYEDRDETDLFREIVEKGFSSRIKRSRLIHRSEWSKYRERLEEEFGLICELGFQRYFLIVWELINWCKSNGIMVGPGRGSVGGSLIAYLMHITDVDPMKYNLVFARFISPARIDLPDIDMDFEDVKRDRVRKHLEECYGSYNVAGLSTFATLKGRGAIRDVARVFDISAVDTDKAAKSIVVRSGGDFRSSFTIEDACATFEDAIAYKKKYPEVVQLAMDLEGQVKGSGQHAAAMCVSSDDLRAGERCHLAVRKGKVVANWDKHDAEYMGVMKLDVLGLTALSILSHTKRLVKDNYGVEIDFDKIPLDDSEVFKEISEGHNIGAFQIGSLGLMKLCKEMGISEFNDIVLASALFRPGTLRSGMVTEFVLRKTGVNKITHAHPLLEPITRETLGIILYQEQVMWFMYNLGGLPWKTCDTVRKVISKSQGEEQFQKFKELFIAGCKERGTLKEDEAGSVWDQLSSFGAYGFNKAHAVEYSLITYWDMWCKVHYPKEFLCASLTHTDDKNKPELVDEARRLGLVLELPKVGSSKATDWVPSKDPSDNRIYMPFREIRGIGEVFAKQLEESDTRPSDHRKEIRPGFFVPKASARKPNAKVIDLLDRIGAFEPDRIYTEEELQEMNQYFSFSLSRDKMGQYSKLCKLMQDSGIVSNISDIDYQYPTNKCSYYFGQMTEIKFGYRKAVEKGAGLARIAGVGGGKDFFESLGGVYGNLKDETDYAMLVFETRTYRAKKFGIEHCAGEWLLTHANHPGRNANLFAMKVWIGQELLDCELDGFDGQLIKEADPYRQADASHCSKCALREECRRPVNPSPGKYNIAIVAEAPGKDEDRKGMGFVGRAGSDILWPELRKHGLTRNMFHVTNVVKCWPSVTRTPKAKHISECSPWLEEELAALKPVMILAFGNTSVKFFKDREGGIMELCEHTPTEWSNKYGCWINWCVHPASVLYSESNKSLFEKGISNFARKLKYIGGESMGKN